VLIAETCGKLTVVQTEDAPTDLSRMEDVLTSNVWGVLKNCEHSVVRSLLASAHPPITGVSGEHLDFRFWERFDDGTEPDLIISAGEDVIIEGYLRKTDNTADIQSIPLDLLFGVDKEELHAWVEFITFLYRASTST
jgi:hypothetical protein